MYLTTSDERSLDRGDEVYRSKAVTLHCDSNVFPQCSNISQIIVGSLGGEIIIFGDHGDHGDAMTFLWWSCDNWLRPYNYFMHA